MTRTPKPALAVLGLFLLTACGTGTDEEPEMSPTQGQEQPDDMAPEETDDGADDGADDADAEAQDGPQEVTAGMDDAVETTTYPMHEFDGEITMGILTPEVQGDTMLVSVVFEPVFEDEEESAEFSELHGELGAVLAPSVHDRENMKAYNVPRVSTNQGAQGGGWWGGMIGPEVWASAIGDVEVNSGQQYLHWAYFPTPEDDIDTVDITVVPGAQEFREIQIDWGDHAPQQSGNGDTSDDDETDDEDGADDDA